MHHKAAINFFKRINHVISYFNCMLIVILKHILLPFVL